MSEKSDPEYVPDDAEPWDNRPDAVNDALICSACGTIGNADDLAFLGEPCPRSHDEESPCPGSMHLFARERTDVAGTVISWRRVGGEPILHLTTSPGGYDTRGAVMLANAILAEVEFADRSDG